jgi:elongator complex protein 2
LDSPIQVKIWQALDGNSSKWTVVADLKLPEAATAVAFAPSNASDQFVVLVLRQNVADASIRRMLAVGLETGIILLFTSADAVKWQMSLEIKAGYVLDTPRRDSFH